jgi:hypothetical protein
VLILDDFGMRELTAAQADDLYELITERAGCSLILTSNRVPADLAVTSCQGMAVTTAGVWLSWPACADGDQPERPGIAVGVTLGSGRCFGRDADRCRLLFRSVMPVRY